MTINSTNLTSNSRSGLHRLKAGRPFPFWDIGWYHTVETWRSVSSGLPGQLQLTPWWEASRLLLIRIKYVKILLPSEPSINWILEKSSDTMHCPNHGRRGIGILSRLLLLQKAAKGRAWFEWNHSPPEGRGWGWYAKKKRKRILTKKYIYICINFNSIIN